MKILFVCTHNRCRSILSEAMMNHMAAGIFDARSAGSQPSGEVHPLSLKYLAEIGVSTQGLKSQSWHEFENWQANIVITVCDAAANESCPTGFADAIHIHWGLSDPSKVTGSESDKEAAFRSTISEIAARTLQLINLDLSSMTHKQQRDALAHLCQTTALA